ncbi:MAG: hypothetical protein U9N87_00220 [Planctomycetota bacterium]|nr:hypothetical protein [Planctomycetota bacterium]
MANNVGLHDCTPRSKGGRYRLVAAAFLFPMAHPRKTATTKQVETERKKGHQVLARQAIKIPGDSFLSPVIDIKVQCPMIKVQ